MKQVDRIREYSKRTPVFDARSAARLIGDSDYTHLLLSHLQAKGELNRLTRGYYTVHNDPSLMVHCLRPAYLGLQDAMSLHNMWEQETGPIIITSRRVRPGTRTVLDSNVIVRRISPRHFFGYEHMAVGEFMLPVSDMEKTFIDMVYFRQRLDSSAIRAFRARMDRKRLLSYLEKYDRRLAAKAMRLLS